MNGRAYAYIPSTSYNRVWEIFSRLKGDSIGKVENASDVYWFEFLNDRDDFKEKKDVILGAGGRLLSYEELRDRTTSSYNAEKDLGVKQHNTFCSCEKCRPIMTELYAGERKLGLWGPKIEGPSTPGCLPSKPTNMYHDPADDGPNYEEDIPNNLDTSGRRVYKEKKERASWVTEAFKAAIRTTNLNLISVGKRLRQRAERNPLRDNIILQSEAVALFKGNFIRLMKQSFDPRDISKIKSSTVFTLSIDDKDTISNIIVGWSNDNEYWDWLKTILTNSSKLSKNEYESLSKECLETWAQSNPPSQTPPKRIEDVNFDSLKNIKF